MLFRIHRNTTSQTCQILTQSCDSVNILDIPLLRDELVNAKRHGASAFAAKRGAASNAPNPIHVIPQHVLCGVLKAGAGDGHVRAERRGRQLETRPTPNTLTLRAWLASPLSLLTVVSFPFVFLHIHILYSHSPSSLFFLSSTSSVDIYHIPTLRGP